MNGSMDNYNGIRMKYHEMQFEKLANHAIRIEFPNSTNAIWPADRLGKGGASGKSGAITVDRLAPAETVGDAVHVMVMPRPLVVELNDAVHVCHLFWKNLALVSEPGQTGFHEQLNSLTPYGN